MLEAFWWVFHVLYHGEFYVPISYDICIGLVFLLSLDGALFVLETWLVEIHLLSHDDGLNRDQNLQ